MHLICRLCISLCIGIFLHIYALPTLLMFGGKLEMFMNITCRRPGWAGPASHHSYSGTSWWLNLKASFKLETFMLKFEAWPPRPSLLPRAHRDWVKFKFVLSSKCSCGNFKTDSIIWVFGPGPHFLRSRGRCRGGKTEASRPAFRVKLGKQRSGATDYLIDVPATPSLPNANLRYPGWTSSQARPCLAMAQIMGTKARRYLWPWKDNLGLGLGLDSKLLALALGKQHWQSRDFLVDVTDWNPRRNRGLRSQY